MFIIHVWQRCDHCITSVALLCILFSCRNSSGIFLWETFVKKLKSTALFVLIFSCPSETHLLSHIMSGNSLCWNISEYCFSVSYGCGTLCGIYILQRRNIHLNFLNNYNCCWSIFFCVHSFFLSLIEMRFIQWTCPKDPQWNLQVNVFDLSLLFAYILLYVL